MSQEIDFLAVVKTGRRYETAILTDVSVTGICKPSATQVDYSWWSREFPQQ
jgi:hypothetical protein